MSDFNENVRQTFENLLKIYQDVATLIRDTDALLEQAGYLCFHGNETLTENSNSLLAPELWFHQYFLRGYASEIEPFDIKAIGLFLLDRRNKPINPMFLYGSCKLTGVSVERRRWRIPFIRDAWFTSAGVKTLDQRYPVENIHGIESGFIQGIALERVKDVSTLRELVVVPLLNP